MLHGGNLGLEKENGVRAAILQFEIAELQLWPLTLVNENSLPTQRISCKLKLGYEILAFQATQKV